VLPLLDDQRKPRFLAHEQCLLLQDAFFSGNHLKHRNFESHFKLTIEAELSDIVLSQSSREQDTAPLDYPISREETMAVLSSLPKGKAAGLDKIFTGLLACAGENLISAIQLLFKLSYRSCEIPLDWKFAEVKFLRKAGKKSYHTPASYRPISLTSCLGKCLDRILTTWLNVFVEHKKIIDKEQEGFRRNHSNTHATLRFVQSVVDGFNDNCISLAAFMEKAFDSVWRDGLLVKLHRQGVKGKV
jgi:hypothetical protein